MKENDKSKRLDEDKNILSVHLPRLIIGGALGGVIGLVIGYFVGAPKEASGAGFVVGWIIGEFIGVASSGSSDS